MFALRPYFSSVTLTLIGAIVSVSCFSQEQTLHFEKYGVENGLPNGQILDIMEDRLGFVWLATIDGLVKFDGYNFKAYNHAPEDNSSIPSSIVHQIMEDSKGGIWVVTEGGLSIYHRKSDNFRLLLPGGYPDTPGNVVRRVIEDRNHSIWAGTLKGLFTFNAQDSTFLSVANPIGTREKIDIRCIMQDAKGRIWAGGDHGLLQVDTQNNRLEQISLDLHSPNAPSWGCIIFDIEEDGSGNLWLATNVGTKIWHPGKNKLLPTPLPDSLANQSVFDILVDRQQILWLAFQHKGLAYLDIKNNYTRHFQRSPYLVNGLASDQLSSLMLDKAGNLWIGMTGGCQKINLSAVKFPLYQIKPNMEASENTIYRVHQDNKGGIWTTTLNGKLFYAHALGMKPRRIFYSGMHHALNFTFYYSAPDNIVWAIHGKNGVHTFNEAKRTWQKVDLGDTINTWPNLCLFEDMLAPGILWIGNVWGLCKVDKRSHRRQWFYPSDEIPSVNGVINSMIQLPDGNILANVGSFNIGTLALFDQTAKKFKPLIFSKDKPGKPEIIAVRNFTLTKEHGVWMALPKGLANYDVKNGKYRILTSKDGLPTTSVVSVLSDERDNIWVAYDGWLSKYMPANDSIVSFDVRAEMEGFYSNSCSKGPDGQLFFGGSSGFMSFHPDSIVLNTTPPRVVLTGFKVLNRSRHFGTAPELIQHITLFHRDNIFSFQFATLNFIDSKNVQYKYKLEGFSEEWVDAGADRTATYTNLNAGDYTFRVISNNRDGVWNEKGLAIKLTILPPLWKTWWAYTLYAALILSSLYFAYRFQLRRKLEHAEALRLKEFDFVKTRLYTNITHEFRTPLTVIGGMVEQIKENPGKWLEEGLEMIRRNSRSLLRLVNQMLDLSKLESGSLPVYLIHDDILLYLKYLCESFHSYAESKNIRLQFETELKECSMDYDPEKVEQIVSNLLSNAIRFTPEGGSVTLNAQMQASGDFLEIRVSDTGIGISEDHLPFVFDRFYQAEHSAESHHEGGTGIGLALTKELVKLLGGRIDVSSTQEEGTEFTVWLPLRQQGVVAKQIIRSAPSEIGDKEWFTPHSSSETELPILESRESGDHLLLIEDNADVVRYLSACLGEQYHLSVASDGVQGLEQALEHIPDLIISDVMMPRMDGFEVCAALKQDERSSHIPVILLTAKGDMASKLEGLQHGADVYLVKPFNKEELLIRVQNLLESRRSLRAHYLALAAHPSAPAEPNAPAQENAFVLKVRGIIEAHLTDPNLDVERLCREVGMSNSNLHRKLTALTGHSANRFVRYIRLTKACALLHDPELTIVAVAYDCGFNDPVYFARAFRQEFGMSPSEWRSANSD